jgi:thienamycin biosynthesis protein ThnN
VTSVLSTATDEHVCHVVRTHLEATSGTPYWMERDRALGTRAYETVKSFVDFERFVGFRDGADQARFEQATRFLPLERFVPASVLADGREIWASQTGGTTGPPKHGTWDSRYWATVLAFSDEFLDLHGVPRDANWLFVGPMGPHTTGRLVVAIAHNRGGRCFSIDLDPRIVKIFGEEQHVEAYDRYVQHIWDQVDAIARYQDVEVLFCTSRLLELLPEYVDVEIFGRLRAVVHAGTTMEPATERFVREQLFPGRPVVGMYGTSTTGISYQKPPEDEDAGRVVYIPSSPYVVLDIVDHDGRPVAYGVEGQVRVFRLTEDSLIPGFHERDRAVRTAPYGCVADRYPWSWISDPYSPEFTVEGRVEGVY